ncbi:hypothetical protein [Paraburkholderia fungorum]|uniref:hypothetical protein n=1 Tax=Paraburkholderia fungorum TaxID=134537 RepID=UPI0004AAEF6D|nr:hypothetical protein [Paraburkholderia fungorum]KFX62369.1 hypothetical protein KBK24_0128360 [Burkholderia sp. K24]USX08861.1 hypothetical protein NHH62_19350 [Paraburkholderia fungorum]
MSYVTATVILNLQVQRTPIMPSDRLQARRVARRQQEERDNRRFAAHQRIASNLRAGRDVEETIAAANCQIELWQRDRLCSRDYIEAWRNVIACGPRRIADVLEERSPYGIRMRQNTPFAHYLDRVADAF